jgi:ankyrin repeat protein
MDDLKKAVRSNDIKKAKKLLQAGADPNINDPLYTACCWGMYDFVKLLLEYKANPNNEAQVLHIACYNKDKEIVKLLLQYGADPFKDEYYKNKVLPYIIKNNLVTEEYVKENLYRIPKEVWEKVYE